MSALDDVESRGFELAKELALELATRGAVAMKLQLLLGMADPEIKRHILTELGLGGRYKRWQDFYSRIATDLVDPATNQLLPQQQLEMFASLGSSRWVQDALDAGATCTANAFFKAFRRGRREVSRLLAECMPSSELGEAVFVTLGAGRPDVAQLLLRISPKPLTDFDVVRLVDKATQDNNLALLRLVLTKSRIDTSQYNSAAGRAIRAGRLEAMEILLSFGASANIALYNAAVLGDAEAAELILERQPSREARMEALRVAMQMNHRQVADLLSPGLETPSYRVAAQDDQDYFEYQDFLEAVDDIRSGPSSPDLTQELENLQL